MPAKLNVGVNEIVELILQLPFSEKQFLFMELRKHSEFQKLADEFLEIGKNLSISFDEITMEVENYRQENFA